jgi:hypothetical protein
MADATISPDYGNGKVALGPKLICVLTLREAVASQVDPGTTRTPAEEAYRVKIEALLAKADDAVLADLWRQVFPYPVDQSPDRLGVIQDLADFAEVLQPRMDGLQANKLCWLIEAYAAQRRTVVAGLRELLTDIGAA